MVAAVLKATSRGHYLVVIETGTMPSQSSPSTTGENLENISWNPAPILSQRIILADQPMKHAFGCVISRGSLGTFTADALRYGQKIVGGTGSEPQSSTFALRGRVIQFDTENDIAAPVGFVSLGMTGAALTIA